MIRKADGKVLSSDTFHFILILLINDLISVITQYINHQFTRMEQKKVIIIIVYLIARNKMILVAPGDDIEIKTKAIFSSVRFHARVNCDDLSQKNGV